MHNTLSNTYTIDLKLTFISFIHSLLYETTYYNVFGALTHHCNLQCHLELFIDKRLYSGKHLMEIRYLNI